MGIIKCPHGKTVFQNCDECEAIWLKERIAVYENKIVHRRAKLAEVERRLKEKKTNC